MPAAAKLLIGLLGVVLLTWLWLGPLGHTGGDSDTDTEAGAGAGARAEAIADAETPAAAAAAEDCRQRITAVVEDQHIQFRSGSPYINPAGTRLLDRIAEAANGCEGVRIEIVGHSDGGGGEGLNLEMSAYRATAVRDALIERGVPADMLRTNGRGAADPIGGNAGDPANRRVDFSVTATGTGETG